MTTLLISCVLHQNRWIRYAGHPLLNNEIVVFSAKGVVRWQLPSGEMTSKQLEEFLPTARNIVHLIRRTSSYRVQPPNGVRLKDSKLNLSISVSRGKVLPVSIYINPKYEGRTWQEVKSHQPLVLFVLGSPSTKTELADSTF